jgi:hypothetical protein
LITTKNKHEPPKQPAPNNWHNNHTPSKGMALHHQNNGINFWHAVEFSKTTRIPDQAPLGTIMRGCSALADPTSWRSRPSPWGPACSIVAGPEGPVRPAEAVHTPGTSPALHLHCTPAPGPATRFGVRASLTG